MTRYAIIKMICRTKEGYRFLAKNLENGSKKPDKLYGNIPYLYSGNIIELELNHNFVINYEFYPTDRNLRILEKNDAGDISIFMEKIKLQKEKGMKWEQMYNITNPYLAYPFEVADKVAFNIGIEKENKNRLDALFLCAKDTLRKSQKEVVSLREFYKVYDYIQEKSPYEALNTIQILKYILGKEDYRMDEKGRFVDVEIEEANKYIDNIIALKQSVPFSVVNEDVIDKFLENKTNLADKQRVACYELSHNHISALGGNAGTGKTYTIKYILDLLEEAGYDDSDILLVAPTGRASRRITEETGRKAYTIHSAIRKTEDGFVYYNQNRKLPCKVMICDESSMVDTLLMADLLKALDITVKLIFVGDDKQLKPVNCGQPFLKFIKECSFVQLDKVFRQEDASGILVNAYAVLGGEELKEFDDFSIQTIKKSEIPNIIDSLEVDQMIVPFNDLRNAINHYVQDNDDKSRRFVKGDKVVALENRKDADGEELYCNGDIGEITSINDREMRVKFKLGEERYKTVVVQKSDYYAFDLAYALTIHKMQGSEEPKVGIFIPLDEKQRAFISPELLYTAITRASKKVKWYYYS